MVPRGGTILLLSAIRQCVHKLNKHNNMLPKVSSAVLGCVPQSTSKCGTKCGTEAWRG
jgi:hypothetical protein